MDAALCFQLTVASLVCSVLALFFSLVAAFPGLKTVLAVVRDGVLWLALLLIIGGISFVFWQHLERVSPRDQASADKLATRPTASEPAKSIFPQPPLSPN